jgi:ApaG protein
VVGEFPELDPGEDFEYTSFCPLPTPMGTMHGNYTMKTSGGERFAAEIAPFTLAVPGVVN